MKKNILLLLISISWLGCDSLPEYSGSEMNLSETTWIYTDDVDTYEITFKSDGKVKTTNANDRTPNNDFWSQNKTTIQFEFNNGYSRYKGKMKSKDSIVGIAKNSKIKWKWTIVRKK